MSVEHERLKEILAEAASEETAAARAAYLDAACQGDTALRQQVEGLLAAHNEAGDFLEQPVLPPAEAPIGVGPGSVVGRYKLLEEIGEGGFGVVFMAEQQAPVRRKVALKIVKAGMDTREVIGRFEAERQALALMDHPNIARVLDAGATESGRPYFVMELVNGIPITSYCDQYRLSTQQRLLLFMKVCQAVQHAHQKGIIHRDLKPTNILVTLIDGEPVPKIIDFGVAKALGQKLTEKTLFTSFQQMIGTPAYMSPEQAALSGVDVDTRSDIYSLGVVLYELLTGVTPFDQETLRHAALDEIRRMIRETEPPKPSTRLTEMARSQKSGVGGQWSVVGSQRWKEVHGDLDWIVMKALEKDRARRYDTANALVEDLHRHLDHQPVQASPPRAVYRMRKFVRRHRVGVVMGALVVVTLVTGLSLALLGLRRALKAEALMRWEAYASDIKAAQVSIQQNNRGTALNLLRQYLPTRSEEDLRGLEWQYLWQESRSDGHQNFPHPKGVYTAVLSPDGHHLATACHDRKIRVWDVDSAQVIQEFETPGFSITEPISLRKAVGFSPDGRRLAILGQGGVEVRETIGWTVVRELRSSTVPVVFSADGRFLVTGGSQ
jgi:eukaryotic-like serine/threonine-protein kinase